MRQVNRIIVHCSATADDLDVDAYTIRKWHLDRGWNDIGYHYVIRRDGTIEEGRPEGVPGAHTKGFNHDSIGVCWVGDKYVGWWQYISLLHTCADLCNKYGVKVEDVTGHYEYTDQKTCPNLDMDTFRENLEQFMAEEYA
jgi:N-acetylmuramoyl-L-alanine amidase